LAAVERVPVVVMNIARPPETSWITRAAIPPGC